MNFRPALVCIDDFKTARARLHGEILSPKNPANKRSSVSTQVHRFDQHRSISVAILFVFFFHSDLFGDIIQDEENKETKDYFLYNSNIVILSNPN